MRNIIISGVLITAGVLFGDCAAVSATTTTALSPAPADANGQVKKGAREVGDKAEDVGDAVKKGAKKSARVTADKAEDVGSAVKKGAQKTGRKIKKVFDD